MYKKFDYTVDKSTFKELPEFVDQVHKEGKKFVVIVVRMLFFFWEREREFVLYLISRLMWDQLQDCGIGSRGDLYSEAKNNSAGYRMYDDGLEMDVFVKNSSGQVLVGKVED